VNKLFNYIVLSLIIWLPSINAQDSMLYDIIDEVSSKRIEKDITKLVSFGTRHSLSDTLSKTRGIGAARRWIKKEFEAISSKCNNCLEVFYEKSYVTEGDRIIFPTWIYNVVAIQRGTKNPNRFIIMSGDIDSRISDPTNYKDDSPGANDNASGMAGTIEAARILSNYKFENSIIYAGLSGEEQGLFGGRSLAKYAKKNDWDVIGILNNDMIGNIEGVDDVIDNRSFRIFSEPFFFNSKYSSDLNMRTGGGENDGASRQLARHVHKTVKKFMPELNPIMIYRLDRFGRGGHHRPFNDEGIAGIRIMEAHENYNRQHNDIRIENGIKYGDVLSGVNFDYAAKLTAVNAISLATLASSPRPPKNIKIGGIVEPSVKFRWEHPDDKSIKGYKIYWRETTSSTWDNSRLIDKIDNYTLEGIVIDNFIFGISTVNKKGFESLVTFPQGTFRD
jgi:hypothetical protein